MRMAGKDRGLSLVELMIGLLAGGIIVFASFKVVDSTFRSIQGVSTRDKNQFELDMLVRSIEKQFKSRTGLVSPAPFALSTGSAASFNTGLGTNCAAPCTGLILRQNNAELSTPGNDVTRRITYNTTCTALAGASIAYGPPLNPNASCPSGTSGIASTHVTRVTVTTHPNEATLGTSTTETYPRQGTSMLLCFRVCPGGNEVVVEGGTSYLDPSTGHQQTYLRRTVLSARGRILGVEVVK